MFVEAMLVVLLVAVVAGVNMIHKAVSGLREQVNDTRNELRNEIQSRR